MRNSYQIIGLLLIISILSCNQNNKELIDMKELVVEWNDANSSKNIEVLSSMYDNTVLYYNVNRSKNDCIKDKLEFFKKYPDYSQKIIGKIETEKTGTNEIKCSFRKHVTYNNKTAIYDSYLIFKEKNDIWLVTTESDLTTDKNTTKIKTYETNNKIRKVFEKNNNIYIIDSNGEQKQLTFSNNDENPIKYNDEAIVFVRNVKKSGIYQDYTRKKIMLVSVDDLTEKTITDKKPFKDGLDQSNEIFNVNTPTLSFDKKSLYFTTEKWATANELVKVNIETGEWTELFSADYFEIIPSGKHIGNFLISRSEIRDKGRAGYFMLVDKKGTVLKDFGDSRERMEAFKNTIQ